jgi:hypothetical protein
VVYIILDKLHNNVTRSVLLLSPFSRGGILDLRGLSNMQHPVIICLSGTHAGNLILEFQLLPAYQQNKRNRKIQNVLLLIAFEIK